MRKINIEEIDKKIESLRGICDDSKEDFRALVVEIVEQCTGQKIEKKIERPAPKEGDVYVLSDGGIKIVLVKDESNNKWRLMRVPTKPGELSLWGDAGLTNEELAAYMERNECRRIGHLEVKFIRE
jgi:hypothetical protein